VTLAERENAQMLFGNILEMHKTYARIAEPIKFIFSDQFRRNKRKEWRVSSGQKINDLIGYSLSYVMMTLTAILLLVILLREEPTIDELIDTTIQKEESRRQPAL